MNPNILGTPLTLFSIIIIRTKLYHPFCKMSPGSPGDNDGNVTELAALHQMEKHGKLGKP